MPPLCLRLVIYRFFASPHACRLSLTAGDDEAGDDEAGDDEAGDDEASDGDTDGDSPDVSILQPSQVPLSKCDICQEDQELVLKF